MKKLLLLALLISAISFAQGYTSVITTKGDLLNFSTVKARLAVGTNDYILIANSSEATGLEWITSPFGDVFKVSTPINNQIGVWTGDGTIEGSLNLIFSGSTLGLGVTDTTQGLINIFGGNASQGGLIRIHQGADDDDIDDSFTIQSQSENFIISGASTGSFFQYNSALPRVRFPDYGSGSITGTPTYNLLADINGNIIEGAIGGGGVTNDTSTAYELVLTNRIVTLNNGSAIALTIPANSAVAFTIGTEIILVNKGAGTVTVGITTDTLQNNVGGVTLAQWDKRTLTKITATLWVLGY